jgi:hypothetical protein
LNWFEVLEVLEEDVITTIGVAIGAKRLGTPAAQGARGDAQPPQICISGARIPLLDM